MTPILLLLLCIFIIIVKLLVFQVTDNVLYDYFNVSTHFSALNYYAHFYLLTKLLYRWLCILGNKQ